MAVNGRRLCCLLLVTILFVKVIQAQKIDQNIPFEELREEVRTLWFNEEYDDAIALLQSHRERFKSGLPGFTIHFYLGLLHFDNENSEKGFEELNTGMDKGYFYSFFPGTQKQIQQYADAGTMLSRNESLRQKALDTTSVKVELKLPDDYDPSKKYPLIIFLHGNNSSLSSAKSEWEGVRLNEPYIVAFVQSSSPVSSYAYNWPVSKRSRKDIQTSFTQLKKKYKIDETKIIIAGFSAGGRMSIDTIMRNTIPAVGFIGFSPAKLSDLDTHLIEQAKSKGRKGAIISGENDYLLTEQLNLISFLKTLEYPLRVVIHSDLGHEYPKDFEYQLNRSLEFIKNRY